jgi:hypothetical protein
MVSRSASSTSWAADRRASGAAGVSDASRVRTATVAAAACMLVACVHDAGGGTADAPANGDGCRVRAIVAFAAPAAVASDPDYVTDLSRAAGVGLTFLRDAGGGLHVYDLTAPEEDGCAAALERLRRDPRVRSADVDARRSPA